MVMLISDKQVDIEGASSGVQPVISGVPQGSVLGRYLLVYIDDVTRVNFHIDCKLTVYADGGLL